MLLIVYPPVTLGSVSEREWSLARGMSVVRFSLLNALRHCQRVLFQRWSFCLSLYLHDIFGSHMTFLDLTEGDKRAFLVVNCM